MEGFFAFIGVALIIAVIIRKIITTIKIKGNEKNSVFDQNIKSKSKLNMILVIAGLFIIMIGQSIAIIPTGNTGVRSTFGQIDMKPVPTGLTFKLPFVQKVELVNNKQQDIKLAQNDNKIWADCGGSETGGRVPLYLADVTVTYQIDTEKSAWIYANVTNYKSVIIQDSLVASSLKNVTAALKTEEVTIRGIVEPQAKDAVQAAVDEKYGAGTVSIIKVVINDMNFEDSYNQSIAQKNQAEMAQKQAEIENKTAIAKAEADRKVKQENAEADAQAMITRAEAEKQVNELRNVALSNKILIQQYIEKWNGELPTIVDGEGNVMLDISSLLEKEGN